MSVSPSSGGGGENDRDASHSVLGMAMKIPNHLSEKQATRFFFIMWCLFIVLSVGVCVIIAVLWWRYHQRAKHRSSAPTQGSPKFESEGYYPIPCEVESWAFDRHMKVLPEDERRGLSAAAHASGECMTSTLLCHFPQRFKFTARNSRGCILRRIQVMPTARNGNGFSDPYHLRGVFLWVPDFSSHSQHASSLAHKLSRHGIAFCSQDHQGFGESEGERGYIENYERVVLDVLDYARTLSMLFPHIPLFLAGHGFGATLALCAAMKAPQVFTRLILISPTLEPHLELVDSAWKFEVARILNPLFPRARIASLWKYDLFSRNRAVAQHYLNDPLLSFLHQHQCRLPNRTVCELLRMITEVKSYIKRLVTPTTALIGLKDQISLAGTCRAVLESAELLPPSLRETHYYLYMWNDLLHEVENNYIISFISEIVHKHISIQELRQSLD